MSATVMLNYHELAPTSKERAAIMGRIVEIIMVDAEHGNLRWHFDKEGGGGMLIDISHPAVDELRKELAELSAAISVSVTPHID